MSRQAFVIKNGLGGESTATYDDSYRKRRWTTKKAFFPVIKRFLLGSQAVNANKEFFAHWHNGFYEAGVFICGFESLGRNDILG